MSGKLLQASLADAQVHQFPHHLKLHLVMEAVAIARYLYQSLNNKSCSQKVAVK